MKKNEILLERYWLKKFEEDISIVELGDNYPSAFRVEKKKITISFPLSDNLINKINLLTSNAEIGRYIYFITALDVLLKIYSGEEKIIVACPELNLNGDSDPSNIIFSVNEIIPSQTIKEVLNKHKVNILEDFKHQGYDYKILIEKISGRNHLNTSGLMQIGFCDTSIQNPLAISNCELQIEYSPEKKCISFIFDPEHKFSRNYVTRFASYYFTVLDRLADQLNTRIEEFTILNEVEKKIVLNKFNNTYRKFPSTKTFIELFEEQSKTAADQIAIVFGNTSLTYKDLNKKANLFARYIRKQVTIHQDNFLAVVMDRSEKMVISILGIWKCGGAYVPVDTGYPEHRILSIIQDASVKAVITEKNVFDADLTGRIRSIAPVIHFEDIKWDQEENGNLNLSVSPNSLAYAIYTSGSTGKPKGAMIEHIGMLNHMYAKINDLNIGSSSVIAQNASHCFDISVWQFFSALLTGGKTVVYNNSSILDPAVFLSSIEKDVVTILEVVPSYLIALLDVKENKQQQSFKQLEFLVVTGEVVRRNLVERWFNLFPNIKMVNAYGPTEASDDITHYIMDKVPSGENIPIGYPVQNFHIYILDDSMTMCPVGVKGQICVSGLGVGRGYIKDQEKTAKSFTTDPFREEKGVRLYKTGDIGRFRADGCIEFFGRKDYQVKIRGHRIELGEIENKLLKIKNIKQAVVLDKEDRQNITKCLVAFIQLHNGITDTEELKEELRKELPYYMIPDHIISLDSFPLTSNGKVDRKSLLEIELADNKSKYVAPVNELENRLVEIWEQILEVNPVGINDNFFELGGHSLKVMRLIAVIHKELNVKLEQQDVFTHQNIRSVASFIEKMKKELYVPISRIEDKDFYEVSHGQKQIWVSHTFQDSNSAYNNPIAFEINGKIDTSALQKAFKQLIRRHEILRTVFKEVEGRPVQCILPFESVNIGVDLSEIEENSEKLIKRKLQEESSAKFDLETGPLLRIKLYKVTEVQFVLIINIHHIVFDAWSGNLLINELIRNYKNEIEGISSEESPMKIQYRDYAAWQLVQLSGEGKEKHQQYWLKKLGGSLPVLNLPTDFKRSSIQTYYGDTEKFSANNELTGALKQIAVEHDASLYMILVSAFKVLLFRYSGQTDIIIGTPASGREHFDLKNQLGYYLNTLALRTQFNKNDTFLELLKNIKTTCLEALEHQMYPFDLLLEDLKAPRDLSRSPLFDVMIDMINYDNPIRNDLGFSIQPLAFEYSSSKYDLILYIFEGSGHTDFRFEFNPDLFTKETIQKMSKRYLLLLKSIVKNTSSSLQSMEIEEEVAVRKINKIRM